MSAPLTDKEIATISRTSPYTLECPCCGSALDLRIPNGASDAMRAFAQDRSLRLMPIEDSEEFARRNRDRIDGNSMRRLHGLPEVPE